MTSIMNKCLSVRRTQHLSSSSPKKAPCTLAMYKIRLVTSSRTFTACGLRTVQVVCERLSVDLQ
jgi:hypothetical protein